MTFDELQSVISANTGAIAQTNQAINFLVSEFIRPNAQQHIQSLERLDRIEGILEAISQQVATNTEALHQYDTRLESTRALVADNGSQIAQLSVKIDDFVTEGRAMRETMQSQLAGILGNARRIDRLEQQAS